MGHYYAEMCCQKCGKIPCKCPKRPYKKRTELEEMQDIVEAWNELFSEVKKK